MVKQTYIIWSRTHYLDPCGRMASRKAESENLLWIRAGAKSRLKRANIRDIYVLLVHHEPVELDDPQCRWDER
jgi:hypothetical protein